MDLVGRQRADAWAWDRGRVLLGPCGRKKNAAANAYHVRLMESNRARGLGLFCGRRKVLPLARRYLFSDEAGGSSVPLRLGSCKVPFSPWPELWTSTKSSGLIQIARTF